MESAVQALIVWIKELNYKFTQLRQQIEHLENLENQKSKIEYKISLGNPQWMEGRQDKGESPRSHAEIETILKNLQERLNSHDNRITGEGVRMGQFVYTSFVDFKGDVQKELPLGGLGIFVDAWSLCEIFNMDYISESSLLERVNKIRGANFKSSGEARVESTF